MAAQHGDRTLGRSDRDGQTGRTLCILPGSRLEADGNLHLEGNAGKATVDLHNGEDLADIADAINKQQKSTGVIAEVREHDSQDAKGRIRKEKELALSSDVMGADKFIRVEAVPADLLQVSGLGHEGEARGRDTLNLGLHILIPCLLLAAALWACYRLVNLPVFADFLIAVEAEMNKVSWPTRPELFRASTVVLIVIFLMGAYLARVRSGLGHDDSTTATPGILT